MRVALLRATLWVLARFPLPVMHTLGALLGRLWWLVPNRLRTVTEINLALCYPQRPAAWRRALARASLRETGKSLCELAALLNWPVERVDALVVQCSGWEHAEQAMQAGHGLIALSPHSGCWELAGLYISRRLPLTLMYQPPRSAALEPLITPMRRRAGATPVPTSVQGVRALYRAVADGGCIGILPDQEPRRGAGVFAPFLGVQAYTMVLVSRLAQRTAAPAITCYMERLPHGAGFHLHVLPVEQALYADDPLESAAAVNRAVERVVQLKPAQYMWNYKRFRRQSEGQRRSYRR